MADDAPDADPGAGAGPGPGPGPSSGPGSPPDPGRPRARRAAIVPVAMFAAVAALIGVWVVIDARHDADPHEQATIAAYARWSEDLSTTRETFFADIKSGVSYAGILDDCAAMSSAAARGAELPSTGRQTEDAAFAEVVRRVRGVAAACDTSFAAGRDDSVVSATGRPPHWDALVKADDRLRAAVDTFNATSTGSPTPTPSRSASV